MPTIWSRLVQQSCNRKNENLIICQKIKLINFFKHIHYRLPIKPVLTAESTEFWTVDKSPVSVHFVCTGCKLILVTVVDFINTWRRCSRCGGGCNQNQSTESTDMHIIYLNENNIWFDTTLNGRKWWLKYYLVYVLRPMPSWKKAALYIL